MSNPSENNANGTVEPEFVVIGLSYRKADAEIRGHFSIPESLQPEILDKAKSLGVSSLSVVSTCNRTELYGYTSDPDVLIELLCEFTIGNRAEFEKVAYILKSAEAVHHLFNVGTGLDSQILGDFEIISQMRRGFKRSKKLGMLNVYMERLANSVIQASKRIKSETNLSTGATSVSFAAVQYILARVPFVSEKNILLFGIGKIGRNTCENLIKHTKNEHITLVNRTKTKAEEIAGKFNLVVRDYANIQSEIAQSDVLIVATGAQTPTISTQVLHLNKPLLILDLSIPRNVDPSVADHPMVTLVHLDDLVAVTNKTIEDRKGEIPKAEAIIDTIEQEFNTWASTRKFAPTLKALKLKLTEIKEGEIDNQRKKIAGFDEEQADILADRLIHKITTQFANHIRNNSELQEDSISLIEQVFEISSKQG